MVGMSQVFSIPFYMILVFLIIWIICIVGFLITFITLIKNYFGDYCIFIDKAGRFNIFRTFIGTNPLIHWRGEDYYFVSEAVNLNRRGKALAVWSVGCPAPMSLKYNDVHWLDSKSLRAIINNDAIRRVVNPSSPTKDIFILLGAIGGIIAGIAAIFLLLVQLKIINMGGV